MPGQALIEIAPRRGDGATCGAPTTRSSDARGGCRRYAPSGGRALVVEGMATSTRHQLRMAAPSTDAWRDDRHRHRSGQRFEVGGLAHANQFARITGDQQMAGCDPHDYTPPASPRPNERRSWTTYEVEPDHLVRWPRETRVLRAAGWTGSADCRDESTSHRSSRT